MSGAAAGAISEFEWRVLAAVAERKIPKHEVKDRPSIIEYLREAEGRAMEFGHTERADVFSKAIRKLESM